MLYQIYIFDTKAVNPGFQNAYIATTLIYLQKLSYIFYKINL